MSYSDAWRPTSFDAARFMIDDRDSDDFWRVGDVEARRLTARWAHQHEVVLDYGCGIGRMLRRIHATRRIGVDVSQGMLEQAAQWAPDCEWLLTPGDVIPMPDASVDFVYSLLVLQHMDADDAAAILSETRRVLRPGGEYLHLFSRFGVPWRPGLRLSNRHATIAYTADVLTTLCCAAGLRDATVGPYGPHDDALGYWEVTNMGEGR